MLFALGCGSDGAAGAKGDPGPAGSAGPAGDPGKDGTDGTNGTDGTVPPLTNDLSGTVTDGTNPLQGVTITVTPGTATAMTSATGTFTMKALDVGAYTLTAHLAGYTDQTVTVAVNLSGSTTVTLALAVDPTQGTPPTVSLTNQFAAGFAKAVTVKATATGTGTLTYAWKQTNGPTVTLTGATTDTIGFTTQDFLTAMGPTPVAQARFGALGVNPDQAGNYVFEVTVTDKDGRVTVSDVTVNATRPTTGLRNVPIGIPVYLQGDSKFPFVPFTPVCASNADCPTATSTCTVAKGTCGCTVDSDCGGATAGVYCKLSGTPAVGVCTAGCNAPTGNACPGALTCSSTTAAGSCAGPQATWNWTIDLTKAAGSMATIQDGTTQFPSFKPDVVGTYKVTDTVSGKTLVIYAGKWVGEMTSDYSAPAATCALCHNGGLAPDVWSEWKTTNHATVLQRNIEGAAGPHFTEACMSCHAVGYDKSAANGGFDDLEATSGWTYPTTLQAGNWNTLVSNATQGPLAGIQCENCHGPQAGPAGGPHGSSSTPTPDTAARISWSSDVCASCHQDNPFNYKPSQWAIPGDEFVGHSSRQVAINEGTYEKFTPSFVAATGAVVPQGNNLKHCPRCHTAQGFAMYAKQINAGESAYLTNDSQPLSAANHPATGLELKAKGMQLATVESQTCQTCHDPHFKDDATHKYQLRIFDKVGALPNGMSNITGMGTGAICVACHNGRNAEHSDFAQNTLDFATGKYVALPNLVGWPTEHDGPQAEMMYGFSAYFMPRYTPSAHLAVTDTCAGCHVKIATGSEVASKQTSNHAFKVDNTICATCHAAAVDGDALQAANALQIDGLRALLAQKTLSTIVNAINNVPAAGAMQVAVRPYDIISDSYSGGSTYSATALNGWIDLVAGTGTTQPGVKNVPTSVGMTYAKNGTTLLMVLNVPNAVTFTPSGTGALPVTTNALAVSLTAISTNQAVPNTLPGWPTAGKYLFTVWGPPSPANGTVVGTYPTTPQPAWLSTPAALTNVQTLMKAYWNISVINNDGTKGIHNPSFFNAMVGKTTAALQAVP
jgi:hypothetical protein